MNRSARVSASSTVQPMTFSSRRRAVARLQFDVHVDLRTGGPAPPEDPQVAHAARASACRARRLRRCRRGCAVTTPSSPRPTDDHATRRRRRGPALRHFERRRPGAGSRIALDHGVDGVARFDARGARSRRCSRLRRRRFVGQRLRLLFQLRNDAVDLACAPPAPAIRVPRRAACANASSRCLKASSRCRIRGFGRFEGLALAREPGDDRVRARACRGRSCARCSASCASRALRLLRAAAMTDGLGRGAPRSRAPGCARANRTGARRWARTFPGRSRTPPTARPRSSTRRT